jgi:hypothetical protein
MADLFSASGAEDTGNCPLVPMLRTLWVSLLDRVVLDFRAD